MVPVAAALIVCYSLLFISGTNGNYYRYRTPCITSSQFRCDSGHCLYKHQWCDGSRHCSDGSDESLCNDDSIAFVFENPCNSSLHFECKNYPRCIPIQGICDGYPSCPDLSDEENCPCEELYDAEGDIEYEAYINNYRTHQKCWKIPLLENQTIELTVQTIMSDRECLQGNITVGYESTLNESDHEFMFCGRVLDPYLGSRKTIYSEKRFTFENTLFIRYRSGLYTSSSNAMRDFIHMKYHKVDALCKQTDVFKCSEYSCISPEKQCDGKKDCENGIDEENCEYRAFSEKYLGINRIKAVQWMKGQHDADWSWKENTHRAVIALQLAAAASYNRSNKDDELFAKQLELEASTFLLRRKIDKISSTELSAFISGLLVICHDPRNFYGYNLISILKEELEELPEYAPPFSYLTLCNAKEPVPQDAVEMLLEIAQGNSLDQGFALELQALATMALSCIINNGSPDSNLKPNMSDVLSNLKKEQLEDGSFGNEYTTALVLQALLATNQENEKDWSPKSALKFLTGKQEENGSFGDFLTTYLVLPLLNSKSLVDIGKINCTEDLKRPRGGNTISDMRSKLGGKVIVKYALYIGDEKDQIHPIVLRTAADISLLELMTLAADIDPKYKFKTQEIKKKLYIYEIANIVNDPEYNKFWFIYQGFDNGTVLASEQSPDKITVHRNDHIILWYKTLEKM